MHTQHFAAWLLAPSLGVLLVVVAVVGRGGPGFLLFALVAAVAFIAGVPLLQFFLLREPQFSGRHWVAAATAMSVAVLFLAIPVYLGVFSFW